MPGSDRSGLEALLRRVERGEWPSTDPWLSVLPAPTIDIAAVVGFTGHIAVAADLDPAWVRDRLPDGDLSAALNPPFLRACERELGRRVNNIDALYLGERLDGPPLVALREAPPGLDHPRVRRARRYRPEVRVWTTDGGVLVVGRGLAGRWEAAIEVDPAHRGRGLGRALADAARRLVPDRRPLWVQIAPGNARSTRAFLAAGYRPVGAEALLVP